MPGPHDEKAAELVTPESVKLVHEAVASTGEASDKIGDGFPLDSEDLLKSIHGVIAAVERADFCREVRECERCLFAGVCDQGWKGHLCVCLG